MASNSFGKLLVDCMPHLRGYAYSLVRNRDAADDLVQETMLRAWTHRRRFARGTNLKAWTFTILRHCFLDQKRRGRTDENALGDGAYAQLASAPQQDIATYFDEM